MTELGSLNETSFGKERDKITKKAMGGDLTIPMTVSRPHNLSALLINA